MNLRKIAKVAALAFAGYCVGVWQTAYGCKRNARTAEAAERFAGKVDELKELMRGGKESVEETAEDIAEMVSDAAEEVADAVEETVEDLTEDVSEDQPED